MAALTQESKLSVLVVDDQQDNLTAMVALLEDLNLDLITARSGQDALRALLNQDVAVILLDALMPGMDGFETARLIRSRERSRHIPIIFLTAEFKNQVHTFQGYQVGAVDYLLKPVDPLILRAKVSVFVELHNKNQALRRHATILSILAHDLVNPLSNIIGYSELMVQRETEAGTAGTRTPSQRILANAVHMQALVQSLLLSSRLEAGSIKLRLEAVNLPAILDEVIERNGFAAADRQVEIRREFPTQRLHLLADPIKLNQMANNLLSNAIKFSPAGSSVLVGFQEEAANVRVFVKDNGPGIPEEEHKLLFRRFSQTSVQATGGKAGVGLGLHIVACLAQAHGGAVSVVSRPGQGSTFSFSLPHTAQSVDTAESA